MKAAKEAAEKDAKKKKKRDKKNFNQVCGAGSCIRNAGTVGWVNTAPQFRAQPEAKKRGTLSHHLYLYISHSIYINFTSQRGKISSSFSFSPASTSPRTLSSLDGRATWVWRKRRFRPRNPRAPRVWRVIYYFFFLVFHR